MEFTDELGLSAAACSVWAKAGKSAEGTAGQWMPLYQHMRDSAATAGVLWDRWLPLSTKRLLAGGVSPALGAKRVRFLAAVHDLGKATPAFAYQSAPERARMVSEGLAISNDVSKAEMWHSVGSFLVLERILIEGRGWDPDVAISYAVVPGSHHGRTPDYSDGRRPSRLTGVGSWPGVQDELFQFAVDVAGLAPEDLEELASAAPLSRTQQVLATAVVILADWLASDTDRFPLDGPSNERAIAALQTIDLPPHWTPDPASSGVDEFYGSRFSTGGETLRPRPCQVDALAIARQVSKPGLMIIEAPMGEGKTEAALAVAETFVESSGAGGVFFALPTMSTADAIFSQRFTAWATSRISGTGKPASVFLSHSRSAMNEEFSALPIKGKLSQICHEDDDDHLVAHEWLNGSKKGVLASFVVGTIDQVIVAALKRKHIMLRHLALMNKVIVIDEIHAADPFMTVYLKRTLQWLGEYGIPVILLSATLPAGRRAELLSAYAPRADVTEATTSLGYPLICATDGDEIIVHESERSPRSLKPTMEFVDGDPESVGSLIREYAPERGVVAVIRNTVRLAQETAASLRAQFPDREVILIHSRFVAQDRARIEKRLRELLGPGAAARPERLIVVGTQVLEQSLDVDFDLMFTDHAPADLILQRLGRLHRHVRERPELLKTPRCFILDATVLDDLAGTVGKNFVNRIYPSFVLARSSQVLRAIAAEGTIDIPGSIPQIVNGVYDTSSVPEDLLGFLADWREDIRASETKASIRLMQKSDADDDIIGLLSVNLLDGGDEAESPEGPSGVREGDVTVEVVVAQRSTDGVLRTLHHLGETDGGLAIRTDEPPTLRAATVLAASVIRLPIALSAKTDQTIGALNAATPRNWSKSVWLKRALPLVLDEQLQAVMPGGIVSYSLTDGLVFTTEH